MIKSEGWKIARLVARIVSPSLRMWLWISSRNCSVVIPSLLAASDSE